MTKEDEKKPESLAENFVATVAKGNLELPAEIAEFTIDQIIDDGILKDIPIVGWIAKGLAISSSISDRIFYHKVLRFLLSIDDIDDSMRSIFIEKIANDYDFKKRVGEHLLIIVDKLDNVDKATLMAKCFNYLLRGSIDHDYFMDLSSIISASTISDLNSLSDPENKRVLFRSSTIAASTGILEYGLCKGDDDQPEMGHRLSDHGSDLRDIFLGKAPARLNKKLERKRKHEEHLDQIGRKHDLNTVKAHEMKSRNMTDSEIIHELSITDHLLKIYLSKEI
jgi:hypothetical protein